MKPNLSDKDTPKDQLTICLNEPFEHGILENVNPDNGGEIPRIGQSIECFTAEELELGLFLIFGSIGLPKIVNHTSSSCLNTNLSNIILRLTP